ncbi:MAG TPA: ABC transporter permease [Chryseolinea sp.]|nr:ABC transporter permease [Chryseolinea sp.]
MIKNYLLITLRNFARNKVFILINLLGMGTAIGCCIVAYLNWQFAASFDSTHINGHVVYRVQATHEIPDGSSRYAVVPTALGAVVRDNVVHVNTVVRYTAGTGDFRIGDEVFNTSLAYADAPFFDLFTFRILDGNLAAFKNKSQVFISETLAKKYFNDVYVAGRQITQLFDGELREYTVGGVFEDQPMNSSFAFEAILLWSNYTEVTNSHSDVEHSWSDMTTLFLRIENEADVSRVESQLQGYLTQQHDARDDFKLTSFYLQPFYTLAASFHGETWLNGEQLRWGIPPSSVIGPAVMAAFLLLLACFNFTNTSLAIAGRRLKEIGIRKAIGGLRSQLIAQFLNESIVLCLLACVAGVLIAMVLTPAYNALWPGIKLSLDVSSDLFFFGFMLALLFITAVIAGAYPALYVTSFRPTTILKGKLRLAGTNWFTRILLTLQFAIALLCLVAAGAFVRNATFQRDYDLGYLKEGVIVVPIAGKNQYEQFRNLLGANKDIVVMAGSSSHVSDRYEKGTIKNGTEEHQVDIVEAGDQYIQAMGIDMVSGRDFHPEDFSNEMSSVLVSEELVKQFGWQDDPLGKTLNWHDTVRLSVIGVVKNIHTDGYWKPVTPVMIRHVASGHYRQLVARTTVEKVVVVNEAMREVWKTVSPNTVYGGKFTDGNISTAKMINDNTVSIFGFLGVVALILSTTGLYALLSINISRRTKEIGIRKVMGAPAGTITRLIHAEFFVILLIASVLGGSLGFFASEKLMNIIWEYYAPAGVETVLIASLVMFGMAIVSVGYKTMATARLNPVQALRDE